jgi:hypothetical protein
MISSGKETGSASSTLHLSGEPYVSAIYANIPCVNNVLHVGMSYLRRSSIISSQSLRSLAFVWFLPTLSRSVSRVITQYIQKRAVSMIVDSRSNTGVGGLQSPETSCLAAGGRGRACECPSFDHWGGSQSSALRFSKARQRARQFTAQDCPALPHSVTIATICAVSCSSVGSNLQIGP